MSPTNRLTVYRSSHPDVLTRWHELAAELDRWRAKVEAVMAKEGFGDREIFYGDCDGTILGVAHTGGTVPHGWRTEAARLVPHRGTGDGKRIAAQLDAIVYPDPRVLPGMPKHARPSEGRGLLTVGPELLGGAVYACWSRPINEAKVDEALWVRIKLSEYYRAVEAYEAEQAKAESSS